MLPSVCMPLNFHNVYRPGPHSNGVRCSKNGVRCSLFCSTLGLLCSHPAVVFAVVFACCSVRILFCSTLRPCCVRCFVRKPVVVFAVLFAHCVLFAVVFALLMLICLNLLNSPSSRVERFVRCSLFCSMFCSTRKVNVVFDVR